MTTKTLDHDYPYCATTMIHSPVGFAVLDDGVQSNRVVLRLWDQNEIATEIIISGYPHNDSERVMLALGRAMVRAQAELDASVD